MTARVTVPVDETPILHRSLLLFFAVLFIPPSVVVTAWLVGLPIPVTDDPGTLDPARRLMFWGFVIFCGAFGSDCALIALRKKPGASRSIYALLGITFVGLLLGMSGSLLAQPQLG